MLLCPLLLFCADKGQRSIGAHSAGVGTFVAVIGALVVLTQGHRIDAIVVHKGHEGELRTFQIVLDDHFSFAERFTHQHITQRLLCFLLVLGYHYALAGRQAIVFEHSRIRIARTHISDSFIIIGKTAVCRCRHMIFGHELFGKLLAGFNLRGVFGMTEHRYIRYAESISHAGRQTGFRSDYA